MDEQEREDERQYRVVRNAEEQYSIWFVDRSLPAGWVDIGKVGSKQDCLSYIEAVWTDMRPRSVREALGPAASEPIDAGGLTGNGQEPSDSKEVASDGT